MLARGTRAKIGTGHQHRTGRVRLLVQDEFRVLAPAGEQGVLEAGTGDPLQVDGGDDLVGVNVALAQRDTGTGVGGKLFHGVSSLRYGACGNR